MWHERSIGERDGTVTLYGHLKGEQFLLHRAFAYEAIHYHIAQLSQPVDPKQTYVIQNRTRVTSTMSSSSSCHIYVHLCVHVTYLSIAWSSTAGFHLASHKDEDSLKIETKRLKILASP